MSENPSRLLEREELLQNTAIQQQQQFGLLQQHQFGVLLAGQSPDPEVVRAHTDQIKSLRKDIEEKDEEISRLKKDVEKLQKQNDELTSTVESKDKEIRLLREHIDKLEIEKTALAEKLQIVECQLQTVRKEVIELKKSDQAKELKNITLEGKVENMKKTMDGVRKGLEETRKENTSLKKELKNLQEAVQHKAPYGASEKMAALQAPSFELNDRASLVLGEMCSEIQAMMYQYVLPTRYDNQTNYKFKHIEEDIDHIEDEKQKSEAKCRLTELKKKLNWETPRHTRAIKSMQISRNRTAHPVLNEKLVDESAALLKMKGKLKGWHSPDCVQELIEVWKKLKQQQ